MSPTPASAAPTVEQVAAELLDDGTVDPTCEFAKLLGADQIDPDGWELTADPHPGSVRIWAIRAAGRRATTLSWWVMRDDLGPDAELPWYTLVTVDVDLPAGRHTRQYELGDRTAVAHAVAHAR